MKVAVCWVNCAGANKDNHTSIVEAGGVAAVLRSMQAHPTEIETVLAQGCFALAALAWRNRACQDAIQASGGLTAVLRVVQLHPTMSTAQQWGLRALFNLAKDHPANKAAVTAARGAQLARTAQRKHPSGIVHEYADELLQLLQG
eukprot:COSAG01_NODE_9777_length_2347_cov_1.999555_2_plen_145_part_00